MKKIMILLAAVFFMLAACSNEKADAPAADESPAAFETIEIEEVQQRQDSGAVVLDVRETDEFAEEHIIGAVNLPLSELQQGQYGDLSKNQEYVVICRSGNRSKTASDILAGAGYTVVNVSEGMSSWTGETER